MSADKDLIATAWQTIGPFFHFALTDQWSAASVADRNAEGGHIKLLCHAWDGDNLPVPDAMIELWQADSLGRYNHAGFPGFGRLCTDSQGSCTFETIVPGRVPGPGGDLQAPHINVSVFARGLLKRLVTRIYFAGNPANESDPVLALVPQDRRATLQAYPDPADAAVWRFDVRLCSDCETVFFDI